MRRALWRVAYGAMFVPLCFGTTVSCGPDHDSAFSSRQLLVRSADQLQSTVMTPHLRAPIRKGQNVVWCNTFQLVWNECCRLIGEDIHLVGEPAMVSILNKKESTREDLDEDSFIAIAGFVRDGIHGRIDRALLAKFKGRARPRYIPSKALTPRPQDIVAYAYLFKNLAFATPFEDLADPMDFRGVKVAGFGKDAGKDASRALLRQVGILDYAGPADFVIELATRSADDRVLLARIAPAATLRQTVAAVEQRIARGLRRRVDRAAEMLGRQPTAKELQRIRGHGGTMGPDDILRVPKFNFDLTRQYARDLCGRLIVRNPKIAKDLWILSAVQNIRFQMDEKGVRLRSEAHMAIGCSALAPRHIMIFDGPFLLMLKRRGAEAPYFAMWVDNAELLMERDD